MALVIAVTLSAAGAGVAVARRWGGATQLAEMGLSATLWVILPTVTFFNVARFHYTGEVGAGIAFAYLGLAVALGLAYLLARRLDLHGPRRGAFLCACFVTNTGFLGLRGVGVRSPPRCLASTTCRRRSPTTCWCRPPRCCWWRSRSAPSTATSATPRRPRCAPSCRGTRPSTPPSPGCSHPMPSRRTGRSTHRARWSC